MAPSAESIQKRQVPHSRDSVAVDSSRPVFNTLVLGEPLTQDHEIWPHETRKTLYRTVSTYLHTIISFCQGASVWQTDGRTDGRTDSQMSIARCYLTKLDAHKNTRIDGYKKHSIYLYVHSQTRWICYSILWAKTNVFIVHNRQRCYRSEYNIVMIERFPHEDSATFIYSTVHDNSIWFTEIL